tara:strand:- start:5663 stop:6184 length:522 start_codon:yes stop_codon:yes gene_type:complete
MLKQDILLQIKQKFETRAYQIDYMSDKSVNVESRTSSQDKRWTIMAALLGTNTAVMLFQGIEQESDPKQIREIALSIIAATLPFQGIYFLIYTYMLENNGKLSTEMTNRLDRASAVCQLVAYLSLVGVGMMWYNISNYVGIFFLVSTVLAILFIRIAMAPVEAEEIASTTQQL